MYIRRLVTAVVIAALAFAGAACAGSGSSLPVIDQAVEDLKGQIDPTNAAHADLVSAGYGLAEVRLASSPPGEKITATNWHHKHDNDAPIVRVHGNKIVELSSRQISFRCEVPSDETWKATQLTQAFAQLVKQMTKQTADSPTTILPADLSATLDGATHIYHCTP